MIRLSNRSLNHVIDGTNRGYSLMKTLHADERGSTASGSRMA
jgi:hypothetical protein